MSGLQLFFNKLLASIGFTDNFNRPDGDLLNNWSYLGTWNIVSGKLVATPATTGANICTNGDFETGNPPTGWNASASNSIAQDADVRPGSSGTSSGKITVGGSAYAVSRSLSGSFVGGRFYQTKYWGKRGTNTQYGVGVQEQIYENNSAWEEKKYGRLSASAAGTANILGSTGNFYVDDIEVKQLVTSHVFAVREFNKSDLDISVKITRTGKDYAGIALCLDDNVTPTDYILIGIDSYDFSGSVRIHTVRIGKVVGGVYTLIQNQGITYVADALLRVIKNGPALKIYYNGSEFSEDIFVSDAGIVNNTKHGLFSAGDGVSFDDFQFLNYSSGVDQTPVFTRVSEATLWSTSGAKDWLGWPQLRDAGGGVWVMTYVASTGHTDNDLTTTIHIRFSNDEGATWTNEDTKLGGGAVTGFPMLAHNPASRTLGGLLIVCPNGDLLFHQYDNHDGTFQWRSEDQGETWTDEGLILDSRFISLDDYKIDGTTIYISVNYTNNSGEPWVNSIYKSTNNGTTWSIHGSSYESDGDEAGFVIAPNGDWIIVMRDNNNAETYQFRSTDGGLTWGPKTVRPELYILQRPRMVLDGVGGIILHGRNYISTDLQTNILYYSNDNGVTWGRRFMPYTTQTGDGNYNGYIIKGDGSYYMISYSGTKSAAGIKRFLFSKS